VRISVLLKVRASTYTRSNLESAWDIFHNTVLSLSLAFSGLAIEPRPLVALLLKYGLVPQVIGILWKKFSDVDAVTVRFASFGLYWPLAERGRLVSKAVWPVKPCVLYV
jgi:hypothetical protein